MSEVKDINCTDIEPLSKKFKVDEQQSLKHEPEKDFTEDVRPEDSKDFADDVDMASVDNFATNNDKYTNYVSPSELEKLREFHVLDEVKSDDENSNDDSEDSDGNSEVPEEEIEKMLEEDLPEDFKGAPKPKPKPYVTSQKIVLEEKGVNQFEVLPLDWMMARHYSGIPVYVHRTTRVATLSKPYFLGKGNTRRHEIPISAIPCLAYRKALEEEEKQREIDRQIDEQIKSGSWQNYINKNTNTDQINKCSANKAVNEEVGKRKCPFRHEKTNKQVGNETENPTRPVQATNTKSKRQKEITSDQLVKTNESSPKSKDDNEINKMNENNLNTTINNETSNEVIKTIVEPLVIEIKPEPNGVESNDESRESQNQDAESTKNIKEANLETNSKEGVNSEIGTVKELDLQEPEDKNQENSEEATSNESATQENSQGGATQESQVEDTHNNPQSEIPLNRQPVVLPGGIVMPPPRVETVSTSWKTQHLTPEQVNDYCKKLFKFKTINIMHFMSWADRRKYTKARKALQYPTLPDGTKLITIPATPANGPDNGGGKANKRDWVMNMNGRSYLSVFHEYVKRALQKQPEYKFKQLENASTPYQATVYIGGMQYGVGHGTSKRSAKAAAARASIHILIPEMRSELDDNTDTNEPDFSFFDVVGIEDPRITEFCAATCEPSPHAILRTCLLRNFGATDKQIHTEMKKLEFQKIELTMKVGKHSATVVCKNKKTAKQRASQAILQALHPHVRSWGSLLRLYGSRSVKSCKEKKLEEQQITLLQDAARHNEPNYAVLEKLRNEMRKLRERDEAVVPIGTLLVKDDLPTHSGSNLNNVDL